MASRKIKAYPGRLVIDRMINYFADSTIPADELELIPRLYRERLMLQPDGNWGLFLPDGMELEQRIEELRQEVGKKMMEAIDEQAKPKAKAKAKK